MTKKEKKQLFNSIKNVLQYEKKISHKNYEIVERKYKNKYGLCLMSDCNKYVITGKL